MPVVVRAYGACGNWVLGPRPPALRCSRCDPAAGRATGSIAFFQVDDKRGAAAVAIRSVVRTHPSHGSAEW